MNANPDTEPRPELVIRRSFDAPRELVYLVWTDPQHLERVHQGVQAGALG